ncbi:MAG: hypothetical protein INF71_11385 [Roseomonas sp.]|jgi:hypothetical protein|nr:hypothetical protein [Roseomonas sp.]MCA3433349.1 hypothetical protein [Roseomonas sp.]
MGDKAMEHQNNLEGLLARNPRARRDEEAIREAQAILDTLKKAGFEQRSYNLASPFGSSSPTPHLITKKKLPVT